MLIICTVGLWVNNYLMMKLTLIKNVELEDIGFVDVDLKHSNKIKEKTTISLLLLKNRRIDSDNFTPYMKQTKYLHTK